MKIRVYIEDENSIEYVNFFTYRFIVNEEIQFRCRVRSF